MAKKKVLILTSKLGYGHIRAAEAIKAASKNHFECQIIDPLKECSEFLQSMVSRIHHTYLNYMPSLWDLMYKHYDEPKNLEKLTSMKLPLIKEKVRKMFLESEADIVISTHPMWDKVIRETMEDKNIKIPFITVITDSVSVHRYWVSGRQDYFVVANEETADVVKKFGVADSKIKIFGFPVAPEFSEYEPKSDFWEKEGLELNRKTILFILGSVPPRNALKLLKKIGTMGDEYQVAVMVGDHKMLKTRLKRAKLAFPYKVFGWTDKMYEYINQSDLVITKAGGATVMECIATRKPMIITHVLPGQEEGNAFLIEKHKLGVLLESSGGSVVDAIRKIESGEIGRRGFFQKLSKPRAAEEIVKFCDSLLQTS